MATHLLDGSSSRYTFEDDVESFVLVVLYCVLRFTDHNRASNIHYILKQVFTDYYIDDQGNKVGGSAKNAMFVGHMFVNPVTFNVTDNPFMTEWIRIALQEVGRWLRYVQNQDSISRGISTPTRWRFFQVLADQESTMDVVEPAPALGINKTLLATVGQELLDAPGWVARDDRVTDQCKTNPRRMW
jgi:hypothetical protein